MNPLYDRVNNALESIRPYLEADGGNVKLLEITSESVVRLALEGNCVSCPMSEMTLKAGVEDAIKKAAPEIIRVEAINL